MCIVQHVSTNNSNRKSYRVCRICPVQCPTAPWSPLWSHLAAVRRCSRASAGISRKFAVDYSENLCHFEWICGCWCGHGDTATRGRVIARSWNWIPAPVLVSPAAYQPPRLQHSGHHPPCQWSSLTQMSMRLEKISVNWTIVCRYCPLAHLCERRQ